MLLAVLAFDFAALAHGDISVDAAALVAFIVGIVALLIDLRARGTV